MVVQPFMVLPSEVAQQILDASEPGSLVVRIDRAENLALVVGFRPDSGMVVVDYTRQFAKRHFTSHLEPSHIGRCHAVDAELHILGLEAARRNAALTYEAFFGRLKGKVHVPRTTVPDPYLTYVSGDSGEVPKWLAWWVTTDGATLASVDIVDQDADPLDVLSPAWPLHRLAEMKVMVVGLGSIGSRAATALSYYGVGNLVLLDPDRLRHRNIARHVLGAEHLGRLKVTGMKDVLSRHRPAVAISAEPLNVVDDADQVREILLSTDVAIVAADGVRPRLAMNRMAHRAGTTAVFAAVLEDGAVGEILRSEPGRGCLLCHRIFLQEAGHFDPEPDIDRGYGEGSAHRPMTAVGPDLSLMGGLAAKTAVAILLERQGMREQRLAGNHAAIGLRPNPFLPPPFATAGPGEVNWSAFPQATNCPTCFLM